MNTNNIKRYAPKARTAFITAMTKRAALFGIRESSIPSMGIEPLEQKGDLALIGDRPFPASVVRPRAALVKKVEQMGFVQAMEQAAYSWFNRLCAIRYMELKGYLDHGRRVLSHPDPSGSFQILDDCLDIELEGLDRHRIAELKLDGTRDEELYRELLLAQCHALHQAMPFLFEAIDDATELLLPDNLTKTDSMIRELVEAIPEEDWQDVEIIGWLYQFYISEKKDQVIGKVVNSEDIPAATQLFTPNWIVQYLVQNSVGRQWMQTYPDSPLKARMPYYIEPAEQTPEVQERLAAITPDSIDPLTIKVLDPACGSGHILVEAYKVLKEIYTERGFRSRDIPQLILEHNLFGLDIDDRAGQLAGFALMMLAREDDRRIFGRLAENGFKLNVLSLQESSHLDLGALWKALNLTSDWQRGQSQSMFDSEQSDLSAAQADNRYQLLKSTLARFTQVKTFGSLIEVPEKDAKPLSELLKQLRQLANEGDSMQKPAAEQLIPLVHQAWLLALRYEAVVANPPYMGSKFYNAALKKFVTENYEKSKGDLYAAFIEKNIKLSQKNCYVGMITIPNWMFLSSFEHVRKEILHEFHIDTFVHNGRGVWGSDFGSCSFVIRNTPGRDIFGKYKKLFEKQGSVTTNEELINRFYSLPEYSAKPADFNKIPGSPIAYWTSNKAFQAFDGSKPLGSFSTTRVGMATGDNEKFVRSWPEVSFSNIGKQITREKAKYSGLKWFPYANGGETRKWYGNICDIVNWQDDGFVLQTEKHETGRIRAHNFNLDKIFSSGITWSLINANYFGARLLPAGSLFSSGAPSLFSEERKIYPIMGFINSKLSAYFRSAINPTLNNNSGDADKLPWLIDKNHEDAISKAVESLVDMQRKSWDSYETSWDFSSAPLVQPNYHLATISSSYQKLRSSWTMMVVNTQKKETEINRILIDAYGLEDEITPDVPIKEITLTCNMYYRYGGDKAVDELEKLLLSDTICELISYIFGCIMGRYSLDREGLVYAHAGNQGFTELVAEGAYQTFPADSDGILPLTDQEWFADDATNRFREFVRTVWAGPEDATAQEKEQLLQANLAFVAESLSLYAIKPKRGESALDTIRRYLSTQFFKDHLKTYKKRPIYWLFSSGKHKAFECLVYLHRYNEGTLARMRTEYVIPLTAKLNTHANKLEQDIDASTSTAEKKALEKQLAALHNQQAELATFDEKLRHHADQRISLDLDEGVKVNYGKFGDLLAEVKAVTGDKGD